MTKRQKSDSAKYVEIAQPRPTGTPIILELDGLLHVYYHDQDLFIGRRASERLKAEQGWFEKLVKHAPTVGSFYEDALRVIIQELLPKDFTAGTGFVFDSLCMMTSKQIDIIIYDERQQAVLFKRGDFAVITPSMVYGLAEVKKTLKLQDIRDVVRMTVFASMGTHRSDPVGCQRLNFFIYASRAKTETIMNVLVDEISAAIKPLWDESRHTGTRGFVCTSFYFFDRDEYIEVRIKNMKETYARFLFVNISPD